MALALATKSRASRAVPSAVGDRAFGSRGADPSCWGSVSATWGARPGPSKTVQVPVAAATVRKVGHLGDEVWLDAGDGRVEVTLEGGAPFSPPSFVVDEP